MISKVTLAVLGLLFSQAITLSQTMSREESAKNDDDPGARAGYDRMRLRNPSTGNIPRSIRSDELAFAATLPTKESLAGLQSYKGKRVSTVQSLAWSQRGPVNVGGRTRALAIDVSDSNIILAGGASGGMWRSGDGGGSWIKVTSNSDLQSVTCIAQDTRAGHTNVWYYGTGETENPSASGGGPPPNSLYAGDGIFKSTDNGVTWARLASTISGTPQTWNQFDFVRAIAVDPSESVADEVYAATLGGIQRSTDGGMTWNTVLGDSGFDYSYSVFSDVAVTPAGVVYAALSEATVWTIAGVDVSSASRGIFRSADGTNWVNILPFGWPAKYHRIVLGVAPSNENVVYFLGETPGSGLHTVRSGRHNWTSFWKYTYLSGDGSGAGGIWENRSANLPAAGPSGPFAHQQSYVLVVKVKPDNENVVFVGTVDLFRSTDGFATTTNTSSIGGFYLNHHVDQHAIGFSPNNAACIFSGNDGGVYKATNDLASTVVWNPLNNGYMTSQFYSVAIDHATIGNSVVVGGTQDNGTWFTNSANPENDWSYIDVGDGAFCAVADGRTSYYTSVASILNKLIYRRIMDDGGNLTAWTRVDPTDGSGYLFVSPFSLDPNNTNMMYLAAGSSLWRNSDLTAIPLSSDSPTSVNWTQLTNAALATGSITAIGISRSPANRLYYGSSDGKVFQLDTANAGNPLPTNVTGVIFPAGAYVSCLAVDPADANSVIAVVSNYGVKSLFSTTDGGTNWSDVSGNLEQQPDGSGSGPSCRWASIIPGTGIFVGTSTGLYSTGELHGDSTIWAQEGLAKIGNAVVDMMDVRPSDGLIVAATHGNGMYSANVGFVEQFIQVRDRWNIVSTPFVVGDYSKSALFPDASSNAYGYNGSYVQVDTLVNGYGYWLKFNGAQTITLTGFPATNETVHVTAGWNLIGSIPVPIAVFDITSDPPAIKTSRFFAYEGSYKIRDTIQPGKGYWVKVKEDGTLILSASPSSSSAANRITIVQTSDLPPEAPGGEITDQQLLVPDRFTLEQSYPNPFNPLTIIRYTLPVKSYVSLKVYNALGQEVATIVDGIQPEGYRFENWNPTDIPSGVYFYRLSASSLNGELPGKFIETRKMLLVR